MGKSNLQTSGSPPEGTVAATVLGVQNIVKTPCHRLSNFETRNKLTHGEDCKEASRDSSDQNTLLLELDKSSHYTFTRHPKYRKLSENPLLNRVGFSESIEHKVNIRLVDILEVFG